LDPSRWLYVRDPSEPCSVYWEVTLYAVGLGNSSPDHALGFGMFDEDIAPQSLSCVQISSIWDKDKIVGCCILLLEEEESMPPHHYRRVGIGWLPSPIIEYGWQEERIAIL